jgi:hypothetical protein
MQGEWLAIIIIALVALFLIKIEHHIKKYKVAAIVIIVAILYFSIMGIFSNEEMDLSSPRGIIKASYIYFGWMGETASKLWDIGTDTASLVGNAIKMNNSEG